MRRFNFNKPLVESPYPPKDTNVLWVDVNEFTGKVANIKKFLRGEWVDYLVFVPEPEIPEPVVGPADNEIWYTTTDGNAVSWLDVTYIEGVDTIVPIYDISNKNVGDTIISTFYSNDNYPIFFGDVGIGLISEEDKIRLTSLHIPSTFKVGSDAFYGCTNLKSIILDDICGVFASSSKTQSYFENCVSLESFIIPKGSLKIPLYCFQGCSSLSSITIPESVTNIRIRAFNNCTSLSSITFEGTVEQWNAITKEDSWKDGVPATYVQCSDGQVEL